MNLKPNNKKELLQAALGLIPSDLVVAGCQMVNVFTGEIYPADIYIKGGTIAYVEREKPGAPYHANQVYDGKGQYLLPGFVDAHMHIESSMMTPRNLAKAIIPHGTTTIIHDPHELANVYGVEGVRYMHDCGNQLPMRQLVDIPSCVPAVPGCEQAGASFGAAEISQLSALERVVGLAEVMDFYGVMEGDDRMMEIIEAAEQEGLYLQGHCPGLQGRQLAAYLCGGPNTCHETTRGDEALEKLRNGMYVDARESSISKNVADIWSGVSHIKFFDTLTLCSDDRECDDLLHVGHLNAVVRKAVAEGMDPVTAIKSATINTAREIGMKHLGAIAPGYRADLVIMDDLVHFHAQAVFFEGRLVAENGRMTVDIPELHFDLEQKNSMHVKAITPQDLTVKTRVEHGTATIHVMEYQSATSSFTDLKTEQLSVVDGKLQLKPGMAFVAVINRYGKGTIGLGVVKHFGSEKGAIASTVSHDSHNLTIVYHNVEDGVVAANELIGCGGGLTAVSDGKVLGTLKLPIGGLMTHLDAEALSKEAAAMKQVVQGLGLTNLENPLLRIVTLALPVIPNVKMSDLGLIHVPTRTILPLEVEA